MRQATHHLYTQILTLRVDPTTVTADPGVHAPELQIPVAIDIPTPPNGEELTVLSLTGKLHFGSPPDVKRVAHSIQNMALMRASQWTPILEFPLSQLTLSALEKARVGSLKLMLQTELALAQHRADKSMYFQNFRGNIEFSIPQSHWVTEVLPNLGFGRYILVELPTANGVIPEAWRYVERAEKSFASWEPRGVLVHCREMAVVLDKTLRRNLSGFELEHWDRMFKHFRFLASLGLHEEEYREELAALSADDPRLGKPYTESVLLHAKAFCHYASQVLERHPADAAKRPVARVVRAPSSKLARKSRRGSGKRVKVTDVHQGSGSVGT